MSREPTRRELQVLALVGAGYSCEHISSQTGGCKQAAVQTLTRVRELLGARSNLQAVLLADRLGWVLPPELVLDGPELRSSCAMAWPDEVVRIAHAAARRGLDMPGIRVGEREYNRRKKARRKAAARSAAA